MELDVYASELRRIRDTVDRLLDERLRGEPLDGPNSALSKSTLEIASTVKRILKFRDLRIEVFDAQLFADPAWDMLLEIFLCDLTQQRISVSAACAGGRVPPTTGLRWAKLLEKRGLIKRRNDPLDSRRVHLSLTEEAFTKMRILMEHRLAGVT
ncbi:hypothetical protein [Sphingomonas sediminicola]|nr:hypothetical protein ['Sphingomonas ginsengisoli' Hoang et al. 2012]